MFGEEKGRRSIRRKERVDPEKNIRNFRRRNYFRRKRRGKEARSTRRGGNNKNSRHDEKKKAAGIDGIPMEAWIYRGSTMRKVLTEILMREEKMERGKNPKRLEDQHNRSHL